MAKKSQETRSANGTGTDLAAVLEKAGAKERAKIEKHLAAADAEGTGVRGRLWRRLVTSLGALAPLGVQSVGNNAWQFFVPDGKYRMQVFALEDSGDGTIQVYLPDVLAEALKAKVLTKTKEPKEFAVKGSAKPLKVDALDAANTLDPPAHYKHMLGWNRKALRVTLSAAEADGPLTEAAGSLFELAAKRWANNASAAPAAAR